jgi:hypothetical protein
MRLVIINWNLPADDLCQQLPQHIGGKNLLILQKITNSLALDVLQSDGGLAEAL